MPGPGKVPTWAAALGLATASLLFTLSAFEAVVRLFVRPSALSWGTIRGHELPPWKVVPYREPPNSDPDGRDRDIVVDGRRITRGDLSGLKREDEVLGYASKESAASANGWWQSNALGARSRSDTPREKPPGRTRVLVFGDSLAAGTRLPQEETWSSILERLRPDLDLVNFGVDGYSMGQSLLLYRRVRGTLDHDVVAMVLAPLVDLWREINTIRSLGEPWRSYTVMPRFVLDDDRLTLVPRLYPIGSLIYQRDFPEPSETLRTHLRKYDRFYLPAVHESPPLLGRLVSYKLLAARRGVRERNRIFRETYGRPDSEAMQIGLRIALQAQDEARAEARRFVLLLFPSDPWLEWERRKAPPGRWLGFISMFRSRGIETIDLLPALASAAKGELDRGYDGTHYGPKTSARIAAALASSLAMPPR